MGSVRKWLSVFADVVTVAVGIVVLAIVSTWLFAPARAPFQQTFVDVYLDDTLGIDFGAVNRTLVMAIQQDCAACQASMAFYRRITGLHDPDVQIVVAAPDHNTGIAAYLGEQRVEPDAIVFWSRAHDVPITTTPTLLMVDTEGVVTRAWIGQLSSENEAEVVDALFE